MFNSINKTTVELSDVVVYVRQDDVAVEISDTVDYNFGILKFLV